MALEAAGVTAVEEAVYRLLITTGPLTAVEVADRLGVDVAETRDVLTGLTAKGLASHTDGLPRRYRPTPRTWRSLPI